MENHFYKIPLLHLHYTYTILGLGLQGHLSEHNQINLTVLIDRTVVLFYQLRYFNLYLCRVIIFNQYLRISIFFASHHPCTVRFTYSDKSKQINKQLFQDDLSNKIFKILSHFLIVNAANLTVLLDYFETSDVVACPVCTSATRTSLPNGSCKSKELSTQTYLRTLNCANPQNRFVLPSSVNEDKILDFYSPL